MTNIKRAISIGSVLLLVLLAYIAYQLISAGLMFARHAEAEYPTAGVIREVTLYVEANNGNWPTSWEQIGITDEKVKRLVVMRFDVTSDQILTQPRLIHELIQPVTGQYRVYPHSEQNLQHLLDTIRSAREQEYNMD